MCEQEYLLNQAKKFIVGVNRDHEACKDISWDSDDELLISQIADATRKSIVKTEVKAAPKQPTIRIARPGESPKELVDRCITGTWRSVGLEHTYDGALDYNRIPNPEWSSASTDGGEWIWQLNRHNEWAIAAQLYNEKPESYLAEAVSTWLANWLVNCPLPEGESGWSTNNSWRTIEIGIRMGSQWPTILSVFSHDGLMDDVLFLAWMQSYAEQADFVWEHRKNNNWLLMEMNGLVHAGVQINIHKHAQTWRKNAIEELTRQTSEQFHPDGFQRELSAGYQVVCWRNYMMARNILSTGDYDIPVEFDDAIRHMMKPWRDMARPNGLSFDFQDSTPVQFAGFLKQVPQDWFEEGDQWFIDGTGPEPKHHHVMAQAGYGVLRSGYDKEAVCVAFDGGPFGDAHQHEDKLSFQLFAHGQDLIGEAGLVDYSDTPERRYSIGTLSHSTAIVDGKGQSRYSGYVKHSTPIDAPSGMRFDLELEEPWLEADYDEGYGGQKGGPVKHTRRITLKKNKTIEIDDTFESLDDQSHDIEILFHCLKDEAQLDGGKFVSTGKGPNVEISWSSQEGELEPSLVKGGDKPDLRGWARPSNYDSGVWAVVPKPCLTLKAECKQTLTVKTIILIN